MKYLLKFIFSVGISLIGNAQEEFHVFPKNHTETPGTENGSGSLDEPWDLQTALSQTPDKVNSGDTIWLHEGIYNGRFVSTLQSLKANSFIIVSAFKHDKVVLNGNTASTRNAVLEVKGKQVVFKNFEITWLGDFSRDEKDSNFKVCEGLRHLTGENCRFYNLRIYNNPGLGIGSWKHAAGTIIEDCMIYYNGYIAKDGKGRGEGIYVQNKSEEERIIRNNIIFNNYYKGIEVWSAGKKAEFQFVKNITLDHNIVFNSGSPSGRFFDNVIVASNDRTGLNIARNIKVLDNVFYHNTSKDNGSILGDAPSLTLGFIQKAPIEDVIVDGNIIVGGYNGLRLLEAKSLQFTNNIVHTGIVQVGPSISKYFENWNANGNVIYTGLKKPYRIPRVQDHSLESWKSNFNLDQDSEVVEISSFNLENILHVSQNGQHKNKFTLALFNAEGNDVTVDFSEYNIQAKQTFKIYDIENPNVVLKTGRLSEDFKVIFPMQLTEFEKPLHNVSALKTLSNFGVFRIEFEDQKIAETSNEKPNLLDRFLGWLGF
jgi:hypothetical protein